MATGSDLELSCKKCRTKLFCSGDLLEAHAACADSNCSSYFLQEPPEWLVFSGGGTEGKLSCPKCDTRIGNWNWSGVKCSCSEWVTPGFQLHCGKMDHNRYNFQNRIRNAPAAGDSGGSSCSGAPTATAADVFQVVSETTDDNTPASFNNIIDCADTEATVESDEISSHATTT